MTDAEGRIVVRDPLSILRAAGWSVAVHNDYRQGGEDFTFWLFTHPKGLWVKGEGRTDQEAVAAAFNQAYPDHPTEAQPAPGAGSLAPDLPVRVRVMVSGTPPGNLTHGAAYCVVNQPGPYHYELARIAAVRPKDGGAA